MTQHNPRYKYDCDRCKFNWCCGPLCRCVLKGYQNAPPHRMKEVNKLLIKEGYTPDESSSRNNKNT